jgi:hypothetical protein
MDFLRCRAVPFPSPSGRIPAPGGDAVVRWAACFAQDAALRPVVDLAAARYGAADGAWISRGIHARLGIAESLLDMSQPAEALEEAALARHEAQAASFSAEIGRAHVVSALAARALGDQAAADRHIEAGLTQLNGDADAIAEQIRYRLQAL